MGKTLGQKILFFFFFLVRGFMQILKKQSKSMTNKFDEPNQRNFDNAWGTVCCLHILTAFIKLLFASKSFRFWLFL